MRRFAAVDSPRLPRTERDDDRHWWQLHPHGGATSNRLPLIQPPTPTPSPIPSPIPQRKFIRRREKFDRGSIEFYLLFFFVFAYRAALGVHSTLFPTDGRSEEPPGVRRRGDVAVGRRTSHRRGDVKRRPHPKLHRPPDVAMATPVRGTCCSRAA